MTKINRLKARGWAGSTCVEDQIVAKRGEKGRGVGVGARY